MIPEMFIEQWRKNAPWQTLAMVEQDLIISRILVDLYNRNEIRETLVFRGGTALNKIYVNPPARYSEDIDLVQIKPGSIGSILDCIRNCLSWLGEPKRIATTRSSKLIYRYNSIDNVQSKLKIEINTTEHFHVEPIKYVNYQVDSEWFFGKSEMTTYELDELMGTKLRALYQRRKGRDLFDLWLVLNRQLINPTKVLDSFRLYSEHEGLKITRALFEKNLEEKCKHFDFTSDMSALLTADTKWNFNFALEEVQNQLISQLAGEPFRQLNKKD